MADQQYCLKWNNFSQHLKYAFNTIWSSDSSFTDVTLAVQGGFKVRAHKMVVAACSNYFKMLLVNDTSESPVLILHDVTRQELEALVHFMYHGEVNVTQEVIPGLLKAAEMLQVRGLCASPNTGLKTSGTTTPTTTAAAGAASRPGKRAAPEPLLSVRATKRGRKKAQPPATPSHLPRLAPAPPPPPPPPPAAPPEARGRSSVESEDSRDTNGVGARADTNGSGGSDNEGELRIDEESNGLEPETLLDEQDHDGDGCSQDSGATDDQFYPLPRTEPESATPQTYTATSRLKSLAVTVKLEPRTPNDLEAAIVGTMPKNNVVRGAELSQSAEEQQRLLAFHEPRPCPHCRRVYRDAATLRTHVAIMHSEGSGVSPCGHPLCLPAACWEAPPAQLSYNRRPYVPLVVPQRAWPPGRLPAEGWAPPALAPARAGNTGAVSAGGAHVTPGSARFSLGVAPRFVTAGLPGSVAGSKFNVTLVASSGGVAGVSAAAVTSPQPQPLRPLCPSLPASLAAHVRLLPSCSRGGLDPFSCSCGAMFRTKHDMYVHKKNHHRA